LTHLTDIMATCLELAGVSYPSEFEGRKIIASPGKSFVSVIRDEDDARHTHRVLVWPHALQDEDCKLVLENPATPELYHIRLDRSEQKNLATEYPERLREMKKTHAKFHQDPKGPKT
jgi:arylsulfatase